MLAALSGSTGPRPRHSAAAQPPTRISAMGTNTSSGPTGRDDLPTELRHQLHQRRVNLSGPIAASASRESEQPFDKLLPAQRGSHLNSEMGRFLADVAGGVWRTGGCDDRLARPHRSLDSTYLEANAPGDHFPSLLHLRVDVLGCQMICPSPEVVHFQEFPVGLLACAKKDDALACDGIFDPLWR